MDPAMFSVANMFGSESGDEEDDDAFVERDHTFPGLVLRLREFAFHEVNANLLWPGASIFAEWIIEHKGLISGRRVLELGSGTGALAIFLKKTLELDITTSDYDDVEIESNIRTNCQLNGLATLPHIRREASPVRIFCGRKTSRLDDESPTRAELADTWGEDFPVAIPDWDLIIASDILLYHLTSTSRGSFSHADVKQYQNLIRTLSYLLTVYKEGSEHRVSDNGHGTESVVTDVIDDDRLDSSVNGSSVQSSGSSGAVSESICNSSYSTLGATTHSSDSCLEDLVTSPLPSEPTFEDDSPLSSSCQAPTMNTKLTVLQGGSLPRRSFLMSWRRRIPKQDEALFFEGCKSAGLNVIDLGSRVYCIHQPV